MDIVDQISKCNIQTYSLLNIFEKEIYEAQSFILSGFSAISSYVTLDEESKKTIENLIVNNRHIDKLNGLSNSELRELETTNYRRYKKLYEIQINKGKLFLSSLFNLHKVYLLNPYGIIVHESPYNIEIKREAINSNEISIGHNIIDVSEDNIQNLFYEINLPRVISSTIPAIYSHEIMHSQTYSIFGSINNIFNTEVLSIFTELLYLENTNNRKTHNLLLNTRLNILKNNITKLDNTEFLSLEKFVAMLYYTSTITAFKLYNIYRKGNILVKKEIIYNIQSIIDGRFTLEDILNKYDLDWTKKRTI